MKHKKLPLKNYPEPCANVMLPPPPPIYLGTVVETQAHYTIQEREFIEV